MKTLDEVIESITTQSGLEIRNVRKPERDRFWVDRDTYNDALFYLKQYQRDKQIYSYDIARRNLEVAERNDPLSWDELKTMTGKPVWVEGEHGCIFDMKSWALVSFDGQGDMKCQLYNSSEFWIGEEDYGTDWQAYRKERK